MACVSGSINVDATTVVRVNDHDSKAFRVRVGVQQGSVLSHYPLYTDVNI